MTLETKVHKQYLKVWYVTSKMFHAHVSLKKLRLFIDHDDMAIYNRTSLKLIYYDIAIINLLEKGLKMLVHKISSNV